MIMDALRNVLTSLQRQGAALGHFNVADPVLSVVESVRQVMTSPLKLFPAQLTSNEIHLSTGR